jgi:hypothetical protein
MLTWLRDAAGSVGHGDLEDLPLRSTAETQAYKVRPASLPVRPFCLSVCLPACLCDQPSSSHSKHASLSVRLCIQLGLDRLREETHAEKVVPREAEVDTRRRSSRQRSQPDVFVPGLPNGYSRWVQRSESGVVSVCLPVCLPADSETADAEVPMVAQQHLL